MATLKELEARLAESREHERKAWRNFEVAVKVGAVVMFLAWIWLGSTLSIW
jgi:hypothetical protein